MQPHHLPWGPFIASAAAVPIARGAAGQPLCIICSEKKHRMTPLTGTVTGKASLSPAGSQGRSCERSLAAPLPGPWGLSPQLSKLHHEQSLLRPKMPRQRPASHLPHSEALFTKPSCCTKAGPLGNTVRWKGRGQGAGSKG